jgi:DNA-binding SARP family transcriptional activator
MEEERSFLARVSAGFTQDDDAESVLRGRDADGKLSKPPATVVRAFPPPKASDANWPVRIRTLGVFSLTLDGKLVRLDAVPTRPDLEFLKTLIALGGREVSPGNLALALWPEADGHVAQRSVDAALCSLRNTLGEACVLLSTDGSISLDPDTCWVDAWDFESTLAVTRRIVNEDATGEDAGRLEQLSGRLLDLYQGHFLTGEDTTSWSVSLRERLRITFIRHLLDAGRYWEAGGLWGKASACYQRGLELDELVEDFYQRLMVCCLETHSISEGLAVYRRWESVDRPRAAARAGDRVAASRPHGRDCRQAHRLNVRPPYPTRSVADCRRDAARRERCRCL